MTKEQKETKRKIIKGGNQELQRDIEKRISQKKKGEKIQKRLKEAETEIETLKDQLLRTAAELDNFRKRTQREISQIIQNANERLIRDILSVIDDLERSLKIPKKKGEDKEFRKGIELIYQKLMTVLCNYGLESMESLNRPFDVERHDALLQIEKEGIPPGIVIEEHEKGYLLNGNVLRHARVLVSK
jgi:molecular chaperone GrpE